MRLFLLALLLLSAPAQAVVTSTGFGPSLTVAGRTFTDLVNLKVLYTNLTASAAVKSSTFRQVNTGTVQNVTGYQVPAGKTLEISACRTLVLTSSNTVYFQIGYGDTDVGFNSASAPTNGAGFTGVLPQVTIFSSQTPNALDSPVWTRILAQKFPYVTIPTGTISAEITCFGYER